MTNDAVKELNTKRQKMRVVRVQKGPYRSGVGVVWLVR